MCRWLHLIFNIIIQLALGIPLEMVHKWWRVGLVYLVGVVAGDTFLAGASGGVYAIMAAHLANVILNWGEMEFAWVRAIALGFVAISDVANAIVERYQGKTNRISYAAHIAGALAGLLIGARVLRNLRVYRWEDILAWVFFSIFGMLAGCAVLWNTLYPSYFPAQQCPPYNTAST
ncbi:RHBDL2 [Cordylochernes scorpioides]|uniref:RHBDL2 n=1 Tax=Cordylochernes scorpioides TaxID=51811 RepID=A0ABY6JZ03_9ARAC|nr:RHBDL2 [Cordylochernes scorpioides]